VIVIDRLLEALRLSITHGSINIIKTAEVPGFFVPKVIAEKAMD
jgi:hypothetical protein